MSNLPPEFVQIVKDFKETNSKLENEEILKRACRTGSIPLVEFLERRGLEIDSIRVNKALRPACQSGNIYLVKWLEKKANLGIPSTHFVDLFDEVCMLGDLDMAKLIDKKGLCDEKNYNESLKSAYQSGNIKLIKWLDKKGKCPPELHRKIKEELGIEEELKEGKRGKCIIF